MARSLTAYLGTAIGVSAETKWRITISGLPKGFNEIDFVAVAVVLILTVIICYRSTSIAFVIHAFFFELFYFFSISASRLIEEKLTVDY